MWRETESASFGSRFQVDRHYPQLLKAAQNAGLLQIGFKMSTLNGRYASSAHRDWFRIWYSEKRAVNGQAPLEGLVNVQSYRERQHQHQAPFSDSQQLLHFWRHLPDEAIHRHDKFCVSVIVHLFLPLW